MDLDEDEDLEEHEALAKDDDDNADGDHGDVSYLDGDHESRLVIVALATRVSLAMIFCMVGILACINE
jgi:hypothetical protein